MPSWLTRRGVTLVRRSVRRLRDDRGEFTSTVIVVPVILVALMLVIQGALVFHARSLVQTAAQSAARATQVEEGSTAAGYEAASEWVVDGGLLREVSVQIDRGPTTVNVTVTSKVQSLVPFWDPTVTATVDTPVEVFRPQGER